MNARTVLRLARKDISLLRWPFLLYVVLGAVAVGLSGIDERAVRSLGLTLAANVLIATCFHLVLSNVLGERRDRTLAFTLSLPVSPREIVAGKLVSSVAMYLACGILATTALVHLAPVDVFAAMAADGRGFFGHLGGWAAYFGLVLGGLLAGFAVVLATAIVSESHGWTMASAVGLVFVVGNGFFLFGPRVGVVARYARDLRQGGPSLYWTLSVEALVIAVILGLTLKLYGRKRSFL
jgi:ABC-2 type transport system permease protein